MISKNGTNFYASSSKLLVFPTSKFRQSPAGSTESYPDGRRFSEYNLTQLNRTIVDYDDLASDGYVKSYELDETNSYIEKLTLVIQGYTFYCEEKLPMNQNWYASILVHTNGSDTLSQKTEDMIRMVDASDGDGETADYYCEGLIFTEKKPNIIRTGTTVTIENMDDPTGTLEELASSTSFLYTIPVVVDNKVCCHRFSSSSIKNICGGTC